MLSGDEHDRELALAEALALSGGEQCAGKLVQAERPIDIARTAYVLCGIELVASGADIAETCEKLRDTGLASDGFAIEVSRIPRGLKVHRRDIANALALAIDGGPDLDDPRERFYRHVRATCRCYVTCRDGWIRVRCGRDGLIVDTMRQMRRD